MRRRILFATLLVSFTAVVVLGVPLGLAGTGLIRSERLRQVDRDAASVAAAVEDAQESGRPVTPELLGRFVEGRRFVEVNIDGDRTVAGEPPTGPRLHTSIITPRGAEVQVTLNAEDLQRETRATWALVAGLGAAAVGASVVVGVVLARRLAAPLDDLASASRRLGSGDFSARTSAHGGPEVEAVADALNHSAERIGYLLATERQFSVDASHQLRTPLTALRMRLEELVGTDDLGVVREEATAALAQADRLTATITELLEFRRRGRVGDQIDLDLSAAVGRHVGLWQNSFQRAGRRLELFTLGPDVVRASHGAVGQALDVLLDNALRHGSGTVHVEVGRAGPRGSVRVSDEGKGVDSAHLEHLFTRDPDRAGHGLGLALARALVESEGGRLELVRARPALFEVAFTPQRTPLMAPSQIPTGEQRSDLAPLWGCRDGAGSGTTEIDTFPR